MLAKNVQIGGSYLCRVSDRLALVTVVRDRGGAGRRFDCLTQDTGRIVRASAAKLRPLPGSSESATEAERMVAAAAKRGPRPFTGNPGTEVVAARPVAGMIGRVGAAPVLRLSAANADCLARIVDAVHVAESFAFVAARVRSRIGRSVQWQTIPRGLRRGLLHAAAVRHAANRATYRAVMGHAPLPSERMVADAVGAAVGLGPMPR